MIELELFVKKWVEFDIDDVFDVIKNSKSYHKKDLQTNKNYNLPYITRTKFNNGLEDFVDDNGNFTKNPHDSIVFGAESAVFFYEPFKYITGNKMYYINDSNFNKYVCLFIVSILNHCIEGSGFGYGMGLTSTRLKRHKIILPVTDCGIPDYKFMEDYMKREEKKILTEYIIN